MTKLTKEMIEDLDAKHGRIMHVKAAVTGKDGEPVWEVVLRKPTRNEYKRLRAQLQNPSQAADAQEQTVRLLVVYPDKMEFDAILEDWVAAADACGKSLLKLIGAEAQEDVKS